MADSYTPEERRAYMNAYYAKRMSEAVASLGGACAVCGTTEQLEFDHIDPSTKIDCVTSLAMRSRKLFFAEVAKCQLLCKEHHIEKTRAEGSLKGRPPQPIKHGTEWAYKRHKCRCELCCTERAKRLKKYRHDKGT